MRKIVKNIIDVGEKIAWLSRYTRLMSGMNTVKDIEILSIEFSSVCNLRCKYCFLDQLDRTRFLDINIYEKLIKEVAENPKYRIKVMEWPISGEFLVYPQWRDAVEITKKYMKENDHFRPHIILNENFMLMDEEKLEFLLKSGVLSQIICSVDGHDAASFEDMRPPGKFPRLIKNMRLLYEMNQKMEKPVHLQVNNGRDVQSVDQPYSEEFNEIFKMGKSITQWVPDYWNESFNMENAEYFPGKGFCTFVFNNVTIASSGMVSKCCMDLRGQTQYADLAKFTLEEIWGSAVRKEFMKKMYQGRRKDIDGCSSCSITHVNDDNRYNNTRRVIKRTAANIFQGKDAHLKPLEKDEQLSR